MNIPGSQARLVLNGLRFRFERMEVRIRAPRIMSTNSEGLPGAVRGNTWINAFMALWKNYPTVSIMPGVAEMEVRVTQASWDFDQVIYQVPLATPIIPQRYVTNFAMAPNHRQSAPQFLYACGSMYVEEANHVVEVIRAQPVDFTMWSNGPFTMPSSALTSFPFPAGGPVLASSAAFAA